MHVHKPIILVCKEMRWGVEDFYLWYKFSVILGLCVYVWDFLVVPKKGKRLLIIYDILMTANWNTSVTCNV